MAGKVVVVVAAVPGEEAMVTATIEAATATIVAVTAVVIVVVTAMVGEASSAHPLSDPRAALTTGSSSRDCQPLPPGRT